MGVLSTKRKIGQRLSITCCSCNKSTQLWVSRLKTSEVQICFHGTPDLKIDRLETFGYDSDTQDEYLKKECERANQKHERYLSKRDAQKMPGSSE